MASRQLLIAALLSPAEEQLDLEDGQWEEVHVVTGALKLFLRELPEPLFPFSFFDKFIAAIRQYSQTDHSGVGGA